MGFLAACGGPPASPTTAPTKAAEATKPAAAAPATAPVATKPAAPAATPPAAATVAATAAKPVATGPKKKLTVVGWSYEPPLVAQNLERFNQQSPDLAAEFQPITGEYITALLPKFQAKTPMDVVYVRDQYLAAWADAGYLAPLDEFPGYKELLNDVYPINAQQTLYKGKNWGTWYYTDFMIMAYNTKMLQEAGSAGPPKTLDELRAVAETIKKKGIVEYPLQLDLSKGTDAMWDYWTYVKASGGRLLNDDGSPAYPDQDKIPLEILKWWVAAANDWKIVNAKANMEPLPAGTLSPYRSGQAAFQTHSRYDLEADNAPERSKIAVQGEINSRMTLPPTLQGETKHTVGWTRLYGIPSYVQDKQAAWAIAQYLGGKDQTGQYYTAKRWWLLRSLGFVFKSLEKDAEVQAHAKKFIHDIDLMNKGQQLATVRDGLNFAWWTEWYVHLQANIQDALLGKQSPVEALNASAKKANELRKA